MRFLNPKTDYAFKKIFGSEASRDILISFLNAILGLADEEVIVDVTIIDPYLAPKIEGMKDTFLDVRVKDQRGRSYIIEMQVLNVEGFEKRILYNACKAYVNQLGKGDPYHILTEVVAVTITDFTMFPDLAAWSVSSACVPMRTRQSAARTWNWSLPSCPNSRNLRPNFRQRSTAGSTFSKWLMI